MRRAVPFVVAMILCVAFTIHIGVVRSQTAYDLVQEMQSGENSVYGNAPLAQEGDEDETPTIGKKDSTKRKPILPLESYYFADSVRARTNFKWNLKRGENRVQIMHVDTLLSTLHIDYPYNQEGVGSMTLGGLGQASQAMDYYKRADYYDFKYAEVFDAYIYRMENAPFYNVKKPLTHLYYLEAGQKIYRETNFGILHAQNVTPSTSFAIDYKSRSTKGQYQRQDTKNHNLAVTVAHTGKRYSLHAGYINNTIRAEEGGGVVGLWTVRDSTFEMPVGVPMKLSDAAASNTYRNNSVFVQQTYGVPLEPVSDIYDFSIADKSAFYIGHSFEYNYWSKVYKDIRVPYTNDRASTDSEGKWVRDTMEYYPNWYIDPMMTRDSLRERVISNQLFVQAQPWGREAVVSLIDGGVGLDMKAYQYFTMDSYLTGEYTKKTRSELYVYGSASGRYRRYFDWKADAKLYPTGYRAGDFSIGGDIAMRAYIRNEPLSLRGRFKTELRSPSFWQDNLISNHYIFLSPLNKESETRFDVTLEIPSINLEIGASEAMISDMIYYNSDSNITQAGDVVSLTSIYLRKNFQWKGLNLDHKVLGQWTSNDEVAPVPQLSAYLNYYYQFWLVKNVLRMQAGIDVKYTTKYYMPDYNPALTTFFNQRSEKLGGYPYMDAYIGAKWKRMRILVKYQHLNQGLFGNDEYFEVANYPLNPTLLKFGISWAFYD